MKQEPPGGQSWRTNCLRRYEFIVFWKEKGIRKRQCHFLHPMIYTPRTENVDKHKKPRRSRTNIATLATLVFKLVEYVLAYMFHLF